MNHFSAFWTRLFALTRKESKQLLRDKSSMAIGFILPIILILLFGYGLSFDLTNGRVGVVEQQPTPQSQQLISGLNGSKYITVKHYTSFSQAEAAMGNAEIDAIVNIPSNFAEQYKGSGCCSGHYQWPFDQYCFGLAGLYYQCAQYRQFDTSRPNKCSFGG